MSYAKVFRRKVSPLKQTFHRTGRYILEFIRKYPHIKYALWVPVFLAAFFITEALIPSDCAYFVSYIPQDNFIPFVEYFVVPYVLWYPFLILTGLYLLLIDGEYFKRYMYFLMIGFFGTLAICLVFPNGQNLRPEEFARDSIFTRMIALLYRIDTNTNVLPSMHVIGCIGAASAVLMCPSAKNVPIKIITVILALSISASTVLIKQHSILDVYAAILFCVPVFLVVYRRKIFCKNQ